MEKNNKNHKTEQSPSDNKKQQLNDDDSRIDVSKSVFQVNREIQAQKQRELEEKQSELLRQHELREKKKISSTLRYSVTSVPIFIGRCEGSGACLYTTAFKVSS